MHYVSIWSRNTCRETSYNKKKWNISPMERITLTFTGAATSSCYPSYGCLYVTANTFYCRERNLKKKKAKTKHTHKTKQKINPTKICNNYFLLKEEFQFLFWESVSDQFKDRMSFYSQMPLGILFTKTPFATVALNPQSTDLKNIQYSTHWGLYLKKISLKWIEPYKTRFKKTFKLILDKNISISL